MRTKLVPLLMFGACLATLLPVASAQDYDAYGEVDVSASQGEEGGMPDTARARQMVEEVRATMAHEPTPRECVVQALRYFRVTPEVLDELRTKARTRAIMPQLTGGYRLGDVSSVQFEQQTITQPRNNDLRFSRRDNAVTVNASWDLREAIFNGDMVQVYSLVGVQRDLILEVLRAYFARRQLALTVGLLPPDDPIALASLMLRIEEFTAVIDMLTGGWFGDQLASRAATSDGD